MTWVRIFNLLLYCFLRRVGIHGINKISGLLWQDFFYMEGRVLLTPNARREIAFNTTAIIGLFQADCGNYK